jgi:hypothetical protein
MQEINLNHKLAELLEQHAVPASGDAYELHIPGSDLRLAARGMPAIQPSMMGLQLDIRLRSPRLLGRRTLVESFSEAGSSLEDAIQKTFYSFSLASLHVILSAFVERKLGAGETDWEQWSSARRAWDICLGPLTPKTMGLPAPGKPLLEDLDFETFLKALRDAFLKEASPRLHWLRVFRGSLHGKCMAREVLLDNSPWKTGEAILDGSLWPAEPDFYSIRHFMVALPVRAEKKWWQFG